MSHNVEKLSAPPRLRDLGKQAPPAPIGGQPPVFECCDALLDVTGRLQARFAEMELRLDPVCAPHDSMPARVAERPTLPGSCIIANKIKPAVGQLYALEGAMRELLDTLEV